MTSPRRTRQAVDNIRRRAHRHGIAEGTQQGWAVMRLASSRELGPDADNVGIGLNLVGGVEHCSKVRCADADRKRLILLM